jgi:RNA polymerase sigma factor (sigma-70 family)
MSQIRTLSRSCSKINRDRVPEFEAPGGYLKFLLPLFAAHRQTTREFSYDCTEITHDEEKVIFEAFHFVKYQTLKALDSALDAAEWERLVYLLRNRLVCANMKLVGAMMKRKHIAPENTTYASEGNLALINAVEGFDPWQGPRFSTYACRSIIHAFWKLQDHHLSLCGCFEDFAAQIARDDGLSAEDSEQITLVRDTIVNNPEGFFTPKEQLVIRCRFGIGCKRMKLRELRDSLGLSIERVRQLEFQARAKIKNLISASN